MKENRELRKPGFWGLVLVLVGMSSGCVVAVRENPQRPTVGMELMDLQKAKDSGVITGQEFEKKRAALLNR